MAKQWKTEVKEYFDIYDRESPCMFVNGVILVGNKDTSHATMVQEMIYNMGFEGDYHTMYESLWESEENTAIKFYRRDIENQEDYVFGHKLKDNIYWDMDKVSLDMFNKLKNTVNKCTLYNHHTYGDYDGGYIIKRFKDYQHKIKYF